MNYQGKNPTLVINARCPQYVEPLKEALAGAGYLAFQSFDLRSTRALHEEGCTCPRHDDSGCTCEMILLLVYPAGCDPITLMLDGRDDQTCVYLLSDHGQAPPAHAVQGITQVLLRTAYQVVTGAVD